MNIINEEILKEIPKFQSTNNLPNAEKNVVCKFFNPCGPGDWYVIEGEKRGDDFIFWGLVEIRPGEREFGYFSLKALEKIELKNDLRIELDKRIRNKKLSVAVQH